MGNLKSLTIPLRHLRNPWGYNQKLATRNIIRKVAKTCLAVQPYAMRGSQHRLIRGNDETAPLLVRPVTPVVIVRAHVQSDVWEQETAHLDQP